ncbi:hypothetical protein BJ170DRAFT_683711 [Xylariales sp. AK1849]|nr:hypothetical protein BJ170DRAFT_683711 [Xylariales sp. AK1849]
MAKGHASLGSQDVKPDVGEYVVKKRPKAGTSCTETDVIDLTRDSDDEEEFPPLTDLGRKHDHSHKVPFHRVTDTSTPKSTTTPSKEPSTVESIGKERKLACPNNILAQGTRKRQADTPTTILSKENSVEAAPEAVSEEMKDVLNDDDRTQIPRQSHQAPGHPRENFIHQLPKMLATTHNHNDSQKRELASAKVTLASNKVNREQQDEARVEMADKDKQTVDFLATERLLAGKTRKLEAMNDALRQAQSDIPVKDQELSDMRRKEQATATSHASLEIQSQMSKDQLIEKVGKIQVENESLRARIEDQGTEIKRLKDDAAKKPKLRDPGPQFWIDFQNKWEKHEAVK